MGAALALVLAGAQLSASIVSAEEMIMEDEELVPDEDDQGAYDDASTTGGQNEEELLGIEVSVDEDMDDIPLIEDDGEEVVSVGEGADLAAVAQAESEADAAAEKVKELLDGIPLQLEPADKEKIEAYLEKLSVTPSPTGSDGELEVAAYIEETMRSFGYTISEQHFHEGFLNEDYVDVPGVNIIAERGANSTEKTREIVLICGHYDSKTNPDPNDPLANDKSSAATLLECARILSPVDSNVDLCFLFLSGEEDGWYGSLRIAEGLTDEIKERIKCVIYVDRVGYVMQEKEAGAEGEAMSETFAAGDATSETGAPETEAAETETKGAEPGAIGQALEGETSKVLDVPPYLIGVPNVEGNDPADLMRALGLYRRADQMLAGDVLYAGEQTMPDAQSRETYGSGETAGPSLEQKTYTTLDWENLERRAAEEQANGEAPSATLAGQNLEMLSTLDDWTIVTGGVPFLQNFKENGMTVASLLQPIDERLTRVSLITPAPEDEAGANADTTGDAQQDISGSLGAQPAGDALLAAGSEQLHGAATQENLAGMAAGEKEPEIIPVLSTEQLAETANYLASAISLYMRSQTSIELD